METLSLSEAGDRLKRGQIGVIPTDTLYGIVSSTCFPDSVERVYQVRGRDAGKPCILLLSKKEEMEYFGVQLSQSRARFLEELWPGKVSIVFSDIPETFSFLHRGTGTLAFRVPESEPLRELLSVSGPIIAPSANPQGAPSARTVKEAENFFGSRVDWYVDGGVLSGKASTVVRWDKDALILLREGAVTLPERLLRTCLSSDIRSSRV
ncbi:MAG: threonylcarbamoyl-AMP synthase [Candidatus Moraniibacteriota bacterium]|nr:MAG: threonylcarbamoyl-AMP synthase [Candidatus Moranbacteria bacterium]